MPAPLRARDIVAGTRPGRVQPDLEGLKEDPRENLQTTGQAIEKAGEDMEKEAQ